MTQDIDTSRTYTAAELGHIFDVSAKWVGRKCAQGKTLRGYRLRRWRDHSNKPYRYELARTGDGDSFWLVCHDMHHVGRLIPVGVYTDEFSARGCARKEKTGEGPPVRIVQWSGDEPEQGVAIREGDGNIEQVRAV